MSARKNLAVDLGATFNLAVLVKDSAGTAIDLTGYTATLKVYPEPIEYSRFAYNTGHYAYTDTTLGADGWVSIKVADEETATWSKGKNPYVLDLLAPNGDVERLMYGDLEGRYA